MEFDHELLFNFVSLFATILLVFVTSTTIFQRLKLRWPLKVNCWFCNKNTKIWRQHLKWWLCPSCEQYNGFSKNGDYAYSIPEQYKAPSNNIKRYCTIGQSSATNEIAKNNLCNECNMNEGIKILKLSSFEPVSKRNYEYELKQFKHNLEEQYPLCGNCKVTVYNVLRKQALWFAQYKMLLFKQKPFRAIVNNARYSESIFRIISIILDSMITYYMDFLSLPVGGLFFQLCACCMAPAKRRSSDILLAFLWICIIILLPFKDMKLLKIDLNNVWFSLEYLTQYHVIMIFAFIIGFVNVKPKYYTSSINKNMSFKKIESLAKDSLSYDSDTSLTADDSHSFDGKTVTDLSETLVNNQSQLNIINGLTPLSVENSATLKSTTLSNSVVNQEPPIFSTAIRNANSHFYPIPQYKNNTSDNFMLNDSLNTLSNLSLSEDRPNYTAKSPNIFEKKMYSTKSPDLFKKLNNTLSKKHILSPPKLTSVIQTSWVAGGYWQEGIDAPTLSRSSSQSSGFGSMGSNFAPSREPSVHEFDQCSITSDATQSCYISRQNNMSPLGSLSYQGSQFSFVEPKVPIYNQQMKFIPHHTISSQPLLQPQNYQRKNSNFADHCLQGQRMNVSDIKSPSEMQMFPSHTTIVTSPVWLPALLCGSVILNIIVLCTTLLR